MDRTWLGTRIVLAFAFLLFFGMSQLEPPAVGSVSASNLASGDTATLIVNLVIVPPPYLASDSVKVNLLVDGTVRARNVQDIQHNNDAVDGSTGSLTLVSGQHPFSLAPGANSSLTGYTSDAECAVGTATPSLHQAHLWTVTLSTRAVVVCTVTLFQGLVPATGQITVITRTQSGDYGEFPYSSSSTVAGTINLTNVGLPDSDDDPFNGIDGKFVNKTSGGSAYRDLGVTTAPGYPAKVVIAQDKLVSPWTFVSLTCSVNRGTLSSFQISASRVTIMLYNDESLTCTYINKST